MVTISVYAGIRTYFASLSGLFSWACILKQVRPFTCSRVLNLLTLPVVQEPLTQAGYQDVPDGWEIVLYVMTLAFTFEGSLGALSVFMLTDLAHRCV